jgi:hypothetical protein
VNKSEKLKKYICIPFVVICTVLLLAGCDGKFSIQKKSESPVIARVGNAVLTIDDLNTSIPDEYRDIITYEQNAHFVRQWMSTELLYQEALRRKVDREREIKARLEKMRKDLLSAEIINRNSFNGSSKVSDQAIREYYENNKNQFIREHDMVRYQEIVVQDLSLAWEIRNTVTHEKFNDVLAAHSKIPLTNLETPPFVPMDAVPPFLRARIVAVAAPSIAGPYRSDEGFYILRILGKYDKGAISTLEEVYEEIAARLTNMAQRGEIDRLIADLRLKTNVEFNTNLIPGSDRQPRAEIQNNPGIEAE